MKPIKFKIKNFYDNRGFLTELMPNKIKLNFNYSIITFSRKNVLRGMHYNNTGRECKLIYMLDGKIYDVLVNLNKGKNFGKVFYFTLKKNVLRGFHFQSKFQQAKYVSVIKGKILDCVIDLRKGSKTFGKTYKIELSEKNCKSLYIPEGFAHGYHCLAKRNSILYFLNQKYKKKNNTGFSWDDKSFNIKWNTNKPILSNKDKNLKRYFKN